MKSSIVFKNIEYKANGLTILSNVSGVVEVEDKYAIVGDNGSGKSTLLEILLGDLTQQSGELNFGAGGARKIKSCRFGVVYDNMPLFPQLKVSEILTFISSLHKVRIGKAERNELLSQFDLEVQSRRKIKVLSSGERQRVALMLSVVHNPDLLILDEAFSNIDPIFFEKIWGYIAPSSRTVVFTSHNWSTLMHHATKVLFLHRGQQLGTQLSPEEHLSRAPGVKKFVFLYTEGLEQRLKEEKFLTYRLEDKVCVFPGDRAEMLETLGVAALLVGAIELKDIYILSKEGKI